MSENEIENEIIDPILQWVTFQLADEIYGINVMRVQEVIHVSEIVPIPGAPDSILGIINLRGNVVTVTDTRRRFGLQATETNEYSRIIITETHGNVIGMLVDRVAEVVNLPQSEIDTAPIAGNDDHSSFIQGVVNCEDYLLIIIDVDKFLADEQLTGLSPS